MDTFFTVSFKYDPRTVTDSYFNPLYEEMLKANGYWPYIFIDLVDGVSIEVERSSRNNKAMLITYGPVIYP